MGAKQFFARGQLSKLGILLVTLNGIILVTLNGWKRSYKNSSRANSCLIIT